MVLLPHKWFQGSPSGSAAQTQGVSTFYSMLQSPPDKVINEIETAGLTERGNKARAARSLDLHRRKLYRLLERFDVDESSCL